MLTIERLKASLAGRYAVERELGQGGMATVFLAHDVRHDREVAIKVLHPDLGAALGGERFLGEIRTTARLQHPHILPLLDSGEADGLLYYVMPYVAGETLRDRLSRERQLPIDDAVRIAREVADALGAAHALGVIHRDIKPENILLQGGHALVSDFGIALAVQTARGERMTQTGLSLGTPQYMSPEQAMGEKQIDGRADIYALGAVTYEMLTGEPPFSGSSVQAIVAKVMSERPAAPHVLRDTVPPAVEAAVLRALAKLPADRPSTAGEFAAALSPANAPSGVAFVAAAADRRLVRRWQYVAMAAAVVAVVAVAFALRRPAVPVRVVRFTMPAPTTELGGVVQPAVSPDGRAVAFADFGGAEEGISLRWIDRDEAELLPGTADARDLTFSPDGKSLAYVTVRGEIRTIAVNGGTPGTLATGSETSSGLAWGSDGFIYFARLGGGAGISRVPAGGGTPEDVVTVPADSVGPTAEGIVQNPVMLDDGRTLLAVKYGTSAADSRIFAVDLRTKARSDLVAGIAPIAIRDGWLLYATYDGSLQAVRFDVGSRRIRGDAVPLLDGVYVDDANAFLAVGRAGALLYQPASSTISHLVWVSRSGVETPLDTSLAKPFIGAAIAPDGGEVAAAIAQRSGASEIWLYNLARRTFSRLSRPGEMSYRPQWSPDGKRVLFSSDHGSTSATRSLYSVPIDGSDSLRLLVASPRHAQEISWPAGGHAFAYRDGFDDGGTLRDIYAMSPGDTVGRPVVVTKADELNPAVSPDGRWLAYTSNASGRDEVYVTPFPAGGARQQVSNAGGTSPVWAHSGRQLFYRDARGVIIATDIDESRSNPAGASHPLFDASRYFYDANGQSFDVAPGDDRFLFIKQPPRASVVVVLDWWSEAAAKLAASGR